MNQNQPGWRINLENDAPRTNAPAELAFVFSL